MAIETLDILISDELREILKPIESQSLVASLLLRGRITDDSLVESPVNYISLGSHDKSKISYISKDRVDSLREGDSPWTSSRRYMAKPGAFVAKLFTDISSKEVETFSNLIRTLTMKDPMRFEVVEGEIIKDYYSYNSYANSNGSLGVSCMKHEHCQKYFDLYTDNTDNLSMLVMLDENDSLMGRALLWNFDGKKIMDRIYTNNDEKLSFRFKQWATENGYLYKTEQNWFNSLFFENVNTPSQELRFDIKLPKYSHDRYPYMDTFKFFNVSKGTFSNYLPTDINEARNFTTLVSTDGCQLNHDHLVFDDISKVYRYRNDAAFIPYRNIWTTRQNAQYSNHYDHWILNDDLTYNDDIGDYIFNDNTQKNTEHILKLIEERKQMREEQRARREEQKDKPSSRRSFIRNDWNDWMSYDAIRPSSESIESPIETIESPIVDFEDISEDLPEERATVRRSSLSNRYYDAYRSYANWGQTLSNLDDL